MPISFMFYCLMHLYANFEMRHLATLESVLKCAIILSYHPPIPLAKPTLNSFKSAPKITPSKPPNSPLFPTAPQICLKKTPNQPLQNLPIHPLYAHMQPPNLH
jgi:hypothetical protein